MIPNNHPYFATYYRNTEQGDRFKHLPVVAWDEEGNPLVLGAYEKKLVRAETIPDYFGVDYGPYAEDGDGRRLGRIALVDEWYDPLDAPIEEGK